MRICQIPDLWRRGGEATTLAGSSLFCRGHKLVNNLSPPQREELTTLNSRLTFTRASRDFGACRINTATANPRHYDLDPASRALAAARPVPRAGFQAPRKKKESHERRKIQSIACRESAAQSTFRVGRRRPPALKRGSLLHFRLSLLDLFLRRGRQKSSRS